MICKQIAQRRAIDNKYALTIKRCKVDISTTSIPPSAQNTLLDSLERVRDTKIICDNQQKTPKTKISLKTKCLSCLKLFVNIDNHLSKSFTCQNSYDIDNKINKSFESSKSD